MEANNNYKTQISKNGPKMEGCGWRQNDFPYWVHTVFGATSYAAMYLNFSSFSFFFFYYLPSAFLFTLTATFCLPARMHAINTSRFFDLNVTVLRDFTFAALVAASRLVLCADCTMIFQLAFLLALAFRIPPLPPPRPSRLVRCWILRFACLRSGVRTDLDAAPAP